MWPQSFDDSAPPAPSLTNHLNNIAGSTLPAKAVIEGPSSYFRLLGIDQAGGGLRHEQFAALLMSATDNRMTLEDIHHVWGEHAKVQQQQEGDGVAMAAMDRHPSKSWALPRPRAGLLLLLPSFLHAFADLARAKYCRHSHHDDDGGSVGGGPGDGDEGPRAVTHLLLRDVFNNIATRSSLRSEKARYGVCAHLVREDVCSFLLSQRPFTTGLFVSYASDDGALTFRDGWGVDKGQNCVRPPSPYACGEEGGDSADDKRKLAVSRNSHMCWTDYLAVASDLQLTPQLMGVDALKVAMEQVFSAPHRVQARGGLGGLSDEHPSDRNEEIRQRSKMGMTYPQFVESLSLLAIHAAERLRFLYPDIAGTDPNSPRKRPPTPKPDGESSSRAHAGARRNDRCSTADKHYSQRVPGVGSRKEARGRPEDSACKKAVRALPAAQLAPGTRDTSGGTPPGGAKSVERGLPVSFAVARRAERSLPYDLGALEALFHHARISYKENRSKVLIRSGTAQSRRVGASSQDRAEATASEQPRGYGSSEQVSSRAEKLGVGRGLTGGVRGAVSARSLRTCGHEGKTVSDPTERTARVYTPTDSARILDAVASRVSKLETENLPSEINDALEPQGANRPASEKLPRMSQARVTERAKPLPPAVGTGGALARLVVIKELQLVPEYAPSDIRRLLELALDHQQAGRYDLALKVLDKTGQTWRALQGGEGRSLPVAAERDGKGVLDGGGGGDGGTYNVTGGVCINDQVHGRRGNIRSEREAVHGDVERVGKFGGGSKWRLDGVDEALLHLMEGSIYQSAGRDDGALSTLLRAEEAVAEIHRDQICLREALTASVLSEMGVALYYCRRTALSLRCFRLALTLRQKLLQQRRSERQETPETGTPAAAPGGGDLPVADGGTSPSPTRGSAVPMPAVEAGEIAAAATLNNIGVCLAGEGDARLAVKYLAVSSKATTSALGIEHPRSAVIARNLALVRGAGRLCSDSIANSGCLHQEAATGEPGVGRWEGGFHYGQGGW